MEPRADQRPSVVGARPGHGHRAHSTDADPVTLHAWICAVAAGDTQAFAALFLATRPQILGIARCVVRSPELAEEVAQEVFVEIWRRADRYDAALGSPMAWLTMITRRRAVDAVRREQSLREREQRHGHLQFLPAFDDVSEAVIAGQSRIAVSHALEQLTERQRGAIELTFFTGHTHRQAATALGVPEGTAKARVRDGMHRLAGLLADENAALSAG